MKLILISTGQQVYSLPYIGKEQPWPINFMRVLIPNPNGRPNITYVRKDKLRGIKTGFTQQEA